MDAQNPKGTGNLLTEALTHISNLVRKEIDLARAELNENMNKAGVAIGMIVGGVVVALVALNVLAGALVAGLAELGIEEGWAALIVGLILAAVAFGLAKKGAGDLKLSSLAPTRTARNVREDTHAVKEAYDGR